MTAKIRKKNYRRRKTENIKEKLKWQICEPNLKVLRDLQQSRELSRFVKNHRQGHYILMQIMKHQDFAPRFLYLKNVLIMGHITYLLFVIVACIEIRWAYLVDISFVRSLTKYLALVRHLMVIFTYARLVERNCSKIAFHAKQCALCFKFAYSQNNSQRFVDLKGYL